MQRFHARLAPYFFAILPLMQGQITTSTIRGTIADKTGAVVPNVEITATNTETNLAQTVRSNSEGQYSIEFLPLGSYIVEGVAMGFKRFVQTGI